MGKIKNLIYAVSGLVIFFGILCIEGEELYIPTSCILCGLACIGICAAADRILTRIKEAK